jgi:hypothetical protein
MTGRSLAVRALAQQLARRYVVADIHRAGQKLRSYRLDEISRMADDYVAVHPELIALARAMGEAMHQRQLAKRELARQRRQQARLANIKTDAPQSEPCSTTRNLVQISGAK